MEQDQRRLVPICQIWISHILARGSSRISSIFTSAIGGDVMKKPHIIAPSIRGKVFWGLLFLIDAQVEVYLGFTFLPKYYIQIVGPINIFWIASTFFATVIGAISFSLGARDALAKLRWVIDGKMTFREAWRGKPVEKN